MNRKTLLLLCAAPLLASPLLAAEPTNLTIAKLGELIASEDFAKTGLSEGAWNIAKGKWEPRDGELVGSELAQDSHAAVLSLQKPNHDSVIQFDFELRGAKSFALSLNHPKGHLWRVTITPQGATLAKDKDKKDPSSKAAVLAKADVALVPGKRYTLTAEVVGTQVAIRIGDQISLSGSHPSFDVDKPNVRFVTSGESIALDNVQMWTASPKG